MTCKDCLHYLICANYAEIYTNQNFNDFDLSYSNVEETCDGFCNKSDYVKHEHGKWVHSDLSASWHGKDECSNCGYHTADRVDLSVFNFCPNCGADMRGDTK